MSIEQVRGRSPMHMLVAVITIAALTSISLMGVGSLRASAIAAVCNPYPDVASANQACGNIEWLKAQSITKPGDGLYHPTSSVNRGSMVAFLFRLTNPGKPSPLCTTRPFPDVSTDNVFCGYIQWAKSNHIAFGYPNGTYGPHNDVTRGAVAAYLHRIVTGKGGKKCVSQPFTDVTVNDTFCGVISWMAKSGITYGVGGHKYGTTLPVTRQAMASFLHRASDVINGATLRPARSPQQVLDSMSLEQRIGQLLMVGTPADGAATGATETISRYHVGSVILTGRSHKSVAQTKQLTVKLQSAAGPNATGQAGLIISTDQEGGQVQVLQGPGFSDMPSALYQGTHYSLSSIRSHAATWGGQLHRAGINLNLAPVMDTVSRSFAPNNAPIGYFDREFGYDASAVGKRATAFANGMRDASVAVSIKHFPGLGRVKGNTDTTAGVTDTTTSRNSASIGAFATGIDAGAKVVMVSTAVYAKIDPQTPAAFSSTVMQKMLRDDLGFTGVILSDALDGAQQVQQWSPALRALKFISNGGDLILNTTTAAIPPMYTALLNRAKKNPEFATLVDNAALHVLQLKSTLGLLG